jgi:RNA polymerase sigma-70 factor (ECF subfamily)
MLGAPRRYLDMQVAALWRSESAAVGSHLEDEPDERVVPRALDGELAAWNILIARHERRVLLTLLARGVRVDRAKDIVQETWARLIAKQREGALERLELPGLAIQQAIWLAIDEQRKRRPGLHVALDPEADRLVDPAPSIEQRLTTRAELERAAAELERCSPVARRVFEIVYEDPGLPHAVAAERAGLSVQRVRQTLCEVRARLRAAMETSDEPS